MVEPTRWGIIGTGSIAHRFGHALRALPTARITAVASRTAERADAFAEEFGVPHRHIGVEALAADVDVDVVYVATPHPAHHRDTITALQGGKTVLCEKPFAMNAAQAEDMVACARARGLFLMEGMWSRFFPAAARVRELVRDGAIGEVRLVQADFGFRCAWDPEGRALNPALGGGALLDVGVYVIAFAQMVFGREPQQIRSMAHLGETGVDEQAGLLLGYDGGGMAVLTCAVQTNTVHDAMIYGTEGHIRIHAPFWQPSRITVQAAGEHEEIEFPHPEGGGFVYEAEAVMACLRAGACECDVMPLDETVLIARIMDRALEQWGLVYP